MAPSVGATRIGFHSFLPPLPTGFRQARQQGALLGHPRRGFCGATFSLDSENIRNFVCPPVILRVSRGDPLRVGSNLFLAGRDRDLREKSLFLTVPETPWAERNLTSASGRSVSRAGLYLGATAKTRWAQFGDSVTPGPLLFPNS